MGKGIKMPNGYGSVYPLSGKRRKPFAVAITIGWNSKGNPIRKILAYTETRAKGLDILLDYRKNPLSNFDYYNITFKDAFNKWFDMIEKENSMSASNLKAYKSIFLNHCLPIHNIKVMELKTLEVQNCIDKCEKGFNTKKYIKLVASQVYKYCIVQLDLPLKRNFSSGLKIGSQEVSKKHKPFNKNEIQILWKNINIEFVDTILLSIYTGLRPGELLTIKLENIFIDDNYMIGGIKTKAGIDRIIPIHKDIVPLITSLLNKNKEYLVEKNNKRINYRHYLDIFKKVMVKLDMDHIPHDGRHTLSTELDNIGANVVCTKLILGHAINDITKGTYTHKEISQLVETINQVSFK